LNKKRNSLRKSPHREKEEKVSSIKERYISYRLAKRFGRADILEWLSSRPVNYDRPAGEPF